LLIFKAIENNCYEYLLLILKYQSKNKEVILDGLNFENKKESNLTPLMKLVKSKHCDDDWINLMLRGFGSSKFFASKITKGVTEAIHYCKNELKNEKWAETIQNYQLE